MLPRDFFARPSVEVAPDLLGCVLEPATADGLVAVRLTEVEAYAGASDPASHAWRGRTARNAVMFGPPGHAYVYFTYGMHFCVNLVCLGDTESVSASAVLLRAGEIVAGEDLARAPRPRPALPGARHRPGPRRRGCVCPVLTAPGQERGGNATSFGKNPDRAAGRGEPRGRDPLAVLVRRGPDGVGLPARRTQTAQTGYPLIAGRWHHAWRGRHHLRTLLAGPDRRQHQP